MSSMACVFLFRTVPSTLVFRTGCSNMSRTPKLISEKSRVSFVQTGFTVSGTPNLFHYVTIGSRLSPHSIHLTTANRLRGRGSEAHDPYETFYRANTKHRLNRLIEKSGLETRLLQLMEPEPSYGRLHAALFYPMMMYERVVNSTTLLSNLRIIIFGVCAKGGEVIVQFPRPSCSGLPWKEYRGRSNKKLLV